MAGEKDLSGYTDEELEAIANGVKPGAMSSTSEYVSGKDLSGYTDEELEAIANQPSTMDQVKDFLGRMVAEPAAAVAQTIATPLVEIDKVTGAPPRAAVGAVQRGEGLEGAGTAFMDQLKAGLPGIQDGRVQAGAYLPTTPTGEQLAYEGMTKGQGIHPAFAKEMAPMMGAVTEGALDVTHAIPGRAIAKGITTAENLAAKAVLRVGATATMGTFPYEKAVEAAKRLRSFELINPGSANFGHIQEAMKEVGAARAALQANRITVPGSHAVAVEALQLIQANRGRLYNVGTANADALLKGIQDKAFEVRQTVQEIPATIEDVQAAAADSSIQIIDRSTGQPFQIQMRGEMSPEGQLMTGLAEAQEALAQGRLVRQQVVAEHVPKDLTLDELDDLTGILDMLVYTPAGNPKGLNRIWGPALKKARASLDASMQTVPQGKLFKAKKQRQEDLMIAAKGRRAQTLIGVGVIGASTAGDLIQDGELSITPGAILGAAMLPQTYFKMVGALKLPGGVAKTLLLAHQTGKSAAMREALQKVSSVAPLAAERVIRGTVLLAGKPAGQQFLTPDEVDTLGANRSFDPVVIAEERERLLSDSSIPSTLKAKRLSEINERGYVVTGYAPDLDEGEPETPDEAPGEGANIETLLQKLQGYPGAEKKKLTPAEAEADVEKALGYKPEERDRPPVAEPIDKKLLDPAYAFNHTPWKPGVKAKEGVLDFLQENVVNPLSERGYEDLGAALATIPGVMADMIPTESGDFQGVAVLKMPKLFPKLTRYETAVKHVPQLKLADDWAKGTVDAKTFHQLINDPGKLSEIRGNALALKEQMVRIMGEKDPARRSVTSFMEAVGKKDEHVTETFRNLDGGVFADMQNKPVLAMAKRADAIPHEGIHYLIAKTSEIHPGAPQALYQEIWNILDKHRVTYQLVPFLKEQGYRGNAIPHEFLSWIADLRGPGSDEAKAAFKKIIPDEGLRRSWMQRAQKGYNDVVKWAEDLDEEGVRKLVDKWVVSD